MSSSGADSFGVDPPDELVARLYGTLRELADHALARRSRDAGLDPTDLVHEAYVKLSAALDLKEVDRPGFVSFASTVIRSVLVDAARRQQSSKRGGNRQHVTLDESALASRAEDVDLLDLDEALTALAALDERQARIVELRFFGGLSNGETGELLGLSARAVSDEWVAARAFLRRSLAARERD